VVGFLIAFIASNFTLCLGFQCSQASTTFASTSNTAYFTFSSSTYTLLKQVFIICELVCAVIFIIFSIIYIILFVKCSKKLPRIHPVVPPAPVKSAANNRLTSSLTQSSRPLSMSQRSHIPSAATQQTRMTPLSAESYHTAEKICPNCGHISPYTPNDDILECPKCNYQSNLVEHAQQW
jgi:ribosomal protein S27AE